MGPATGKRRSSAPLLLKLLPKPILGLVELVEGLRQALEDVPAASMLAVASCCVFTECQKICAHPFELIEPNRTETTLTPRRAALESIATGGDVASGATNPLNNYGLSKPKENLVIRANYASFSSMLFVLLLTWALIGCKSGGGSGSPASKASDMTYDEFKLALIGKDGAADINKDEIIRRVGNPTHIVFRSGTNTGHITFKVKGGVVSVEVNRVAYENNHPAVITEDELSYSGK